MFRIFTEQVQFQLPAKRNDKTRGPHGGAVADFAEAGMPFVTSRKGCVPKTPRDVGILICGQAGRENASPIAAT